MTIHKMKNHRWRYWGEIKPLVEKIRNLIIILNTKIWTLIINKKKSVESI